VVLCSVRYYWLDSDTFFNKKGNKGICTALKAISKTDEDHGEVILTEKMKPDVIKLKKELVNKKYQ